MLDPVTALGLASSILEIVEFSSKLLGTSKEVYDSVDGSTKKNLELKKLTEDLRSHSQALAQNRNASKSPISDDERALQGLAELSDKLAHDLLDVLEDQKVKGKGNFRTWESLQVAFKTARKAGEIERMQHRLKEIELQVNTRLVSIIRKELKLSVENLTALNQAHHDVYVSKLNDTRQDLLATINAVNAAHQDQAKAQSDTFKLVGWNFNNNEPVSKNDKVLDSLLFPELHMRRIKIEDAHTETLKWLFEDATTFKSWLESSHGVFWFNGKAGSGKSTLMKFIAGHPRTRKLLQTWAGRKTLVVASFYFWSSGHPMQKTQHGLLQSLVYQILRQCPDLIRRGCPQRWEQAATSTQETFEPWTRKELSNTLQRIVGQGKLPARFCFFIDGMDEYEGDQYQLICDFEHLARSDSTKLCVSSRPWNVFRKAYGNLTDRHLVLENLTKADMRKYIKDVLEGDPRFRRLSNVDPGAQLFVDEIRDRANGVFLWIFLVVRSLLYGLNEDDNITMLLKRLRDIPRDLEEYFQKMLDSVDDIYKVYTARALQLAVHASEPLPILLYWFLPRDIENPGTDWQGLLLPNMKQMQEEATTSINKWCRDLLETRAYGYLARGMESGKLVRSDLFFQEEYDEVVMEPVTGSSLASIDMVKVDFLHRTVRDFLETAQTQRLPNLRAGESFNHWSTLCRLYLAEAMAADFTTHWKLGVTVFARVTGKLMHYAKQQELREVVTPFEILMELNRTGEFCFPQLSGGMVDYHWTDFGKALGYSSSQTHDRLTFTAFAVAFGLEIYVKQVLESTSGNKEKDATALLDFALRPTFKHPFLEDASFPNYAMVRMLLEHGVNVNQMAQRAQPKRTVWHQFLATAALHGLGPEAYRTSMLLQRYGADMTTEV